MQSVTNFLPLLIIYFLPISYIAGGFYASQQYFQPVLWASAPHPRPMAILINNHGTTHQGKSASHNLKGKTNLRNWLTMKLKNSIHRLVDAELQETTQLVQSHGPPTAIPERRSMPLKGSPRGWVSEAPKCLIKGESKHKTSLTRNLRRVPS